MQKKYAFIWDLDGTLLDSYDEIVSSVLLTLEDFGIIKEAPEVLSYVIRYSVRKYFHKIEQETGIPYSDLDPLFQSYHHSKDGEVKAAAHSLEILEYLNSRGIPSFVFTHRERSTIPILSRLGMLPYFSEVLKTEDGYARKPDPQALCYLIDKYDLDPACTYYVGDRAIDIQCGKNAGIGTIMYIPSTSPGNPCGLEDYVISDLMEIRDLIVR